MLPRELPMPDVVESDSDSAWAAFQETPQASETPVPDIAGSKDFDPTMYSDTVPSPGADSRGSTPQEPFISTYKDLIEEIDSEQAELTRQRKQPK